MNNGAAPLESRVENTCNDQSAGPSKIFLLHRNSLVVLDRQVDSVLVAGGGQVLLQTLDLLGVFLTVDRHTSIT